MKFTSLLSLWCLLFGTASGLSKAGRSAKSDAMRKELNEKRKLNQAFMAAMHENPNIDRARRKGRTLSEKERRRKLHEQLMASARKVENGDSDADAAARDLADYQYSGGNGQYNQEQGQNYYRWNYQQQFNYEMNMDFDMSARSFKYAGCAAIKTYDEGQAQDPMRIDTYAVFRLCPAEKCNKYSMVGCGRNYGEYVVEMQTYLGFMLEYYEERYTDYCEFCLPCDWTYQTEAKMGLQYCYATLEERSWQEGQEQQQRAWEQYYQANGGDMAGYNGAANGANAYSGGQGGYYNGAYGRQGGGAQGQQMGYYQWMYSQQGSWNNNNNQVMDACEQYGGGNSGGGQSNPYYASNCARNRNQNNAWYPYGYGQYGNGGGGQYGNGGGSSGYAANQMMCNPQQWEEGYENAQAYNAYNAYSNAANAYNNRNNGYGNNNANSANNANGYGNNNANNANAYGNNNANNANAYGNNNANNANAYGNNNANNANAYGNNNANNANAYGNNNANNNWNWNANNGGNRKLDDYYYGGNNGGGGNDDYSYGGGGNDDYSYGGGNDDAAGNDDYSYSYYSNNNANNYAANNNAANNNAANYGSNYGGNYNAGNQGNAGGGGGGYYDEDGYGGGGGNSQSRGAGFWGANGVWYECDPANMGQFYECEDGAFCDFCEFENEQYFQQCDEYMCQDYYTYCTNEYYGEVHQFDIFDFLECNEFVNEQGQQFYIAPHCGENHYTISLGVYADENCAQYIGETITMSQILGYRHEQYEQVDELDEDIFKLPKECISCDGATDYEEYREWQENDGDMVWGEGRYYNSEGYRQYVRSPSATEEGIVAMCMNLYQNSAPCSKNMDQHEYLAMAMTQEELLYEERYCAFIDNIVYGAYDDQGDILLHPEQFDFNDWRNPDQYRKLKLPPGQAVGLALSIIFFVTMLAAAIYTKRSLTRQSTPWTPKRTLDPNSLSRQNSGIVMGRSRSGPGSAPLI